MAILGKKGKLMKTVGILATVLLLASTISLTGCVSEQSPHVQKQRAEQVKTQPPREKVPLDGLPESFSDLEIICVKGSAFLYARNADSQVTVMDVERFPEQDSFCESKKP